MLAIFKREFKSYFISPIGYVLLAIFLFFSGWFFVMMFTSGLSDITAVFSNILIVVLFLIPILTMRLMSEDRRQRVDQALFTAPVRLSSIIFGKFFAALAVLMLGFSITLLFQIIIAFYVSLNWWIFIGNLLGILLFGSSLIAIGLFFSSLTESQMVAAVASFAVSLVVVLMDSLVQMINVEFLATFIGWISFSSRYSNFMSGQIDFSNVIFFLGVTAIFLFATLRVLEKKRWA